MDTLDSLLAPMHYLNDLKAIWDKLSDEEREEIESSRVYKDNDHDKKIQAGLVTLGDLGSRLKGFKYRALRKSIREYIAHWKTFEPDQMKILQALIKQHMG